MTHEIPKPTPIQLVAKYWFLIVVVIGTIATWTTLNNKVESHAEEIKSLKSADIMAASANSQILVELSAIRTDLLWLKNNIK